MVSAGGRAIPAPSLTPPRFSPSSSLSQRYLDVVCLADPCSPAAEQRLYGFPQQSGPKSWAAAAPLLPPHGAKS
jgi:hypothetical protein